MPKTTLPSIKQIQSDFEHLTFAPADSFYFSAKHETIFFEPKIAKTQNGFIQLLHEISHALCRHHHYESGIQLLKMESEAWAKAKQIAKEYDIEIPEDLIEQCLNTYRDWLHLRSTCPECSLISTEIEPYLYRCFNCATQWSVPLDQRTRRYRHRLVTVR